MGREDRDQSVRRNELFVLFAELNIMGTYLE
jgi:hypothetical protein